LGIDFSLDAFVSPEGEPLQRASRKGSRPFNLGELKRITRVAYCLSCHDTYDDFIYLEWNKSLQRFQSGKATCEGLGVPRRRPSSSDTGVWPRSGK
jgi:hypothetical protein